MTIGSFRKNVMKTARTKQAKMGLKQVARNTQRTNVLHAVISLNTSTGHVLESLTPYILGDQFTEPLQEKALVDFGNIGASLVFLARTLKVKTPTATKRVKLVGTRTAGLLRLSTLATHLLHVAELTFNGPAMKHEKKLVTLPNKGGAKEERVVEVIDLATEVAHEQNRLNVMTGLVTEFVDLYWRLSFDIFKAPPALALAAKLERMTQEFPDITFEDEAEEAETDAAAPTATATTKPVAKSFKVTGKKPELAATH